MSGEDLPPEAPPPWPPPLPPVGETAESAVPPVIPPLVAPPGPARVRSVVWWGLAVMLVVPLCGLFLEGELGGIVLSSSSAAPFAVLGVLAYLGDDRQWARVLSYVWLGFLFVGGLGMVLMVSFFSLVQDWSQPGAFPLQPGAWQRLLAITGLGGLTLVVGLGALVPRCRRLVRAEDWARIRVLALAVVVTFTGLSLVPLVVLRLPPVLVWLQRAAGAGQALFDARGANGMLRDEFYGLCWTLLAAAFAVGYGVRRDWRQTLERLGLLRPTRLQLGLAVGLTALLLGATHAWEAGIARLWEWRGWPVTDAEAVEALFEFAFTPVGAVVIGVAAGLGEEVAVRGILQPRLGLVLSNVFFTALHALQYHWDALLSVFLTGLVLGLIRQRSSTTVSALVHGGYDFVLLLHVALTRTPGG
jgi:membrane protease YdiL (CAAX protease family)